MINLATTMLVIFLIGGGVAGTALGWVSPTVMLDAGMVLACLAGLGTILKLPWDLYFEACQLQKDQEESLRAGIKIDETDVAYAARARRRLIWLCLGLHLLAAVLSAGTSWLSGGQLGYYFAGFFLVSTSFRPLGAFYVHLKRRLVAMRNRTRYPRDDSANLRSDMNALQSWKRQFESQVTGAQTETRHDVQELRQANEGLVRQLEEQRAVYNQKVDRVCREFTNSIEKLTEDRELLHGMRAFVRMVKEA